MKVNKTTEERKHQTTGKEKTNNQRVALIRQHTIKSLKTKTKKWQESLHAYQY
jgi:hypothetical protein